MSLTKQCGFSLLQGIFALVIFTITTICTAPVFYRLVGDRHLVAYTNELVGTLQQARRMAVTNVSTISLCSSDNGRQCTHTPWSQGYIAFQDSGELGVVDGDDRIVRSVQPRIKGIRVVLSGADHIRFNANGAAVAAAPMTDLPRLAAKSVPALSLARVLSSLSPIALAHAATAEQAFGESMGFLVCSGPVGRAIRITAIGRLDTQAVTCN